MYRRFAVILGGISMARPGSLAKRLAASPPQISTTGIGEAFAIPDRATIYIGVQTRATTASAAVSRQRSARQSGHGHASRDRDIG